MKCNPNFLFENKANGRFEEIGLLSGTAVSAGAMSQAGMGPDAGNYDNEGDLDLCVANLQLENYCLYRNDGGLAFTEVSYKSASARSASTTWASGSASSTTMTMAGWTCS